MDHGRIIIPLYFFMLISLFCFIGCSTQTPEEKAAAVVQDLLTLARRGVVTSTGNCFGISGCREYPR